MNKSKGLIQTGGSLLRLSVRIASDYSSEGYGLQSERLLTTSEKASEHACKGFEAKPCQKGFWAG